MFSLFKSIIDDGKPPSLWDRFKWWSNEEVFLRLPRSMRRVWYYFSHWWYSNVSCRLWPRQRWLTRQIPREWEDKSELVRTLLYALVINLVEEERCFEVTDWAASGLVEQEVQLRTVYIWAKTGRAIMEKQLEAAYGSVKPLAGWLEETMNGVDEVFRTHYDEIHRLETLIEETDTKHLIAIVKFRELMWI